jgi:RNA polymerase-binding transcription factor DksA
VKFSSASSLAENARFLHNSRPTRDAEGGSTTAQHTLRRRRSPTLRAITTKEIDAMETETRACRICGEEIPTRRVEAMPETRVCVGCSAKIGGEFDVTAHVGHASPWK